MTSRPIEPPRKWPFGEGSFPTVRRLSRSTFLALTLWTFVAWLWEHGLVLDVPREFIWPTRILDILAIISLAAAAILRLIFTTTTLRTRTGILGAIIAVFSFLRWLHTGDARLLVLCGQIVHLASSPGAENIRERLVQQMETRAARLVPLSFLICILAGTLLLSLPVSVRHHSAPPLVDALFTSTSATCVTGLIVHPTPTYFSGFGHWVILALIQAGGLGTMTLSLAVLLLFRSARMGRQRQALLDVLPGVRRAEIYHMVRFLFLVTFGAEALGWLALSLFGFPASPSGAGGAFLALFHAVSAFCNAGFSLYNDSLSRWPASSVLTIAGLVIIGGLGFIVLREFVHPMSWKLIQRQTSASVWWSRLSLHTKMALITTAVLLVLGTTLVFYGEFDSSLREYAFGTKILHSFFQSVTMRTAGFNTIPIEALSPALLFGACLFMFIGACPGSTAGGIKTTTAAVLLLSLKSMISTRGTLEFHGRRVDERLFQKAVAIALTAMATLSLGIFLLLVVEAKPTLSLIFEAASAFGTVGLSTGITGDLSVQGKLIIIVLMYAGRVGPLTIALSLGMKTRSTPRHQYPTGNVLVG